MAVSIAIAPHNREQADERGDDLKHRRRARRATAPLRRKTTPACALPGQRGTLARERRRSILRAAGLSFSRSERTRRVLVVIQTLSDRFDFFFELELLAFHRRRAATHHGRMLGLIFDDQSRSRCRASSSRSRCSIAIEGASFSLGESEDAPLFGCCLLTSSTKINFLRHCPDFGRLNSGEVGGFTAPRERGLAGISRDAGPRGTRRNGLMDAEDGTASTSTTRRKSAR